MPAPRLTSMTWTIALQVNDQPCHEIEADGSFDDAMSVVGAIIVALTQQLPTGGKITLAVER